ncbi:MAG: GAF domain-containing protein, partial [Planctomycetes bacterium]|nr:GAF domain-containing protein [Planctomycetota bacterium]
MRTETVYRTKKPLYVPDLLDSPWSENPLVGFGFRSVLVIPIHQDGRYIAHWALSSSKAGAFTKADEEFLMSIADHVGPAIRNASLFRTAHQRAERFKALNEVNQKISENLALSDVLDTLVRAVVELLKGDYSRIFLLDGTPETLILRATQGQISGPPEEGLAFRVGEGVIGNVVQSGEAVILPDVHE